MRTTVAIAALAVVLGHTAANGTGMLNAERQRAIDLTNAATTLWQAGVNDRFADLAPGASRSLCGVKEDFLAHVREQIRNGSIVFAPEAESFDAPASFDVAEHWPQCKKVVNDIRDQSACGCCWAFGPASAASDRLCIATNASVAIPLSAQETW